MKGRSIVIAIASQEYEVIYGHRCLFGEKLDVEIALLGMERRHIPLRRINLHLRWTAVLLRHVYAFLPTGVGGLIANM